MPSKLSIVIPCHNEHGTIRTLLERVLAVRLPDGWEREIIIVDDASTDGTREILQALALPVRVIYRTRKGGKGTALVDGFKEATGTHLLIQDADLEYDPKDIPALMNALHGDKMVVYGSRYLRPSGRGSLILRAGVWVLTALINRLYGSKLTDANTCYKLFPRELAERFPRGGFEADMLFGPVALRAGYTIREIPITYAPRTVAAGKKIKYRDGLRAILALLKDYQAHSRAGIMPSTK